MSTTTTNYGLVKSAESENQDVAVLNANFDTIDTQMKTNKDAATAAQADATTNADHLAKLPIAMDAGEKSYVFGGGNTLAQTINFATGRFSSPPIVQATIRTAVAKLNAIITTAPSTSSVGITVATVDGTTLTGTVYVNWTAVQM